LGIRMLHNDTETARSRAVLCLQLELLCFDDGNNCAEIDKAYQVAVTELDAV